VTLTSLTVHALGWIVVHEHSLDLVEERLAIADSGTEPARRPRFRERALHPVLAQWVGPRPFGSLAVGLALKPRLERGLQRECREQSGRPSGIVAGGDQVAKAERVGLIFLLAREAQGIQPGPRQHVADARTEDRAENLAEHPERVAPRISLADVSVIGRDVPDLMPQREEARGSSGSQDCTGVQKEVCR